MYETRASLLRRYSEPVEQPPLWKMRRWQKVTLLPLSHYHSPLYSTTALLADWTNVNYIPHRPSPILRLPSSFIRCRIKNWSIRTRHIPSCHMLDLIYHNIICTVIQVFTTSDRIALKCLQRKLRLRKPIYLTEKYSNYTKKSNLFFVHLLCHSIYLSYVWAALWIGTNAAGH